jgi:uncharacterized protein (TIGR03382 family)
MKLCRTTLATAALSAALLWAPAARAFSSFYTANCTSCHSATVTTCNGCHSHGTHSSSAKTDINVAGALSKTSYAPGETVSVLITGGYRTGWIRALLFDGGGNELARSSCPGGMGGCTTSAYPVTLTAPAPTTPGTYTWAVAWYGNQFDASGASFGSGTSTAIQPGYFTPDPNNPGHGYQTVALQPFTVAAPAAPSIALSPPSLTFPTVTLGGTAQQTTQVQNTGTAPLSVTAISLCPGTSPVFSWSPAAPITVAAGGSATLTVTYAPLAAGTDSGCLAIASNDPANPTVSLGLTGTAVAPTTPAIALSPASLDFGSVTVGSAGTLTTQVQNTGTATLDVTAITACSGTSPEFAWSPPGPFSVAPGQSATLTVTYAPTGVGADTGCLSVASNAATSPTQLLVSGVGTAVPVPSIALSPSALDFGAVLLGSTSALPVQVRNTGSAPLTVTTISLCPGTPSAFSWSPGAPFTVPAGQAATLQVTYTPAIAGMDTGCLAIASDDPVNPTVNLGLSGSGVTQATPSIALVPPSLDFGMVTVGSSASLTTQIQNAGTAPLNVSAIALCSGTSTAYGWTPAAPFTVAAGATATLTVTYAPTAAQTDTGCLAVSSDDPANPTANLALTGTGVSAPVSGLDVDLEELGVPRLLDTRRARTITPEVEVKNTGSVAGTAQVTVVGARNGAEVYRQSLPATLEVGADAELEFPPYSVEANALGAILWTATVEDQDPDVDLRTATTQLGPRRIGDDHRWPGGGDLAMQASSAGAQGGCSTGGEASLVSLALLAAGALFRRRTARYGA